MTQAMKRALPEAWRRNEAEARVGEPTDDGAHGPLLLVVDDDAADRAATRVLLEERGHRVAEAATGEEALQALEREPFDIMLVDLHMPRMSGLAVLSAASVLRPDAQVVLMTAHGSVDTAVEAMKSGAFDYLTKPLRPDELIVTVDRAWQELELRREVARLRGRAGQGARSRMIGRAPTMQRVFELIDRVAPMRATVLITGETGTGKELVARAIHDLSPRARRAFVPINCSALPESLLESELFGHVKGSFTGAIASRRGLIEEAHGGTLFLDEIATISPGIQVKLLRVLEERKIQRVGGGGAIPVDFRLIAATNRDLAAEVAAGRFREDLFYRLDVFPIPLPPLRERRSDIPLLAHHFRMQFAKDNGFEPPAIPAATLARMMEYDWPGNVRELENFIERAVIMYAGAKTIGFDPPANERARGERALAARARAEAWTLERLEREYIFATLEATGGHQRRAAEILGIDRRTLYRKLRRYRGEKAR